MVAKGWGRASFLRFIFTSAWASPPMKKPARNLFPTGFDFDPECVRDQNLYDVPASRRMSFFLLPAPGSLL